MVVRINSSLDVIEPGGVGVEGVELNEDEDEERNEGGVHGFRAPMRGSNATIMHDSRVEPCFQ